MRYLRNTLLAFLLLCRAAHAVVEEGTHIVFSGQISDPIFPGNYFAIVYRLSGPTTSGYSGTSFNYDPDAGTINIGFTIVPDTYSNWFVAHFGDVFDADTIAAQKFIPIYPYIYGFNAPVGTSDFYLAATVSSAQLQTTLGYGWINIHRQADGTLVAVDNAVSYGPGIIVGTLTEVPEPSSFILLALASAGLLWRARRYR